MDIDDRSRLIINKVLARNDRFGRSAPNANSAGKPGRWISDDARWMALVVPGHLPASQSATGDACEGDWDLFQLHCFERLRMTAHMRGDEVVVRLYHPGPWERLFFPIALPDATPILPGGYAGAQFMARGADANARVSL